MSKLVDFGSIAVGEYFIKEDTLYNPDDERPHTIFLKVNHAAYQQGMRYPTQDKIILPREGFKHKTMHSPQDQIKVIQIPRTYRIERSKTI